MYPELKDEEIKDITTDSIDEFSAQATSSNGDDVSENTVASSCDSKEREPEKESAECAEDSQSAPATPGTESPSEESTSDSTNISEEEAGFLSEDTDCPPPATSSENYLLYGGTDVPDGINYKDTLEFLVEKLKYDGGELYQARQKKDGSGIVKPDEKVAEYCSYCGLPISGVDYYRLPDGRKRCTNCNRSLVKTLEELNAIFNDVLLNMELFFGSVIDVPISVQMLEERKLKKKIGKGLGTLPKNALILGVAVEHKKKYTIYIENGIPRASLIATLAHELTHIWQYTHWDAKAIKKKYGSKMRLVVYEGMAMWTEIQYLYHIGEQTIAKRSELTTLARNDEYGVGFAYYADQYPLVTEAKAFIQTPFLSGNEPLDLDI